MAQLNELVEPPQVPQDVHERLKNEMHRMRTDMGKILVEWSVQEQRKIFTGPFQYVFCPNRLEGETVDEQCVSAVSIGGFTYLFECVHLGSFEVGEQLRQAKVKMMEMLVPRDMFFRSVIPQSEEVMEPMDWSVKLQPTRKFLKLPADVIGMILERSHYPTAQSLALTCQLTNTIYRKGNSTMLLPDLILILDFSTGHLQVRFWREDTPRTPGAEHPMDDRKKNQIIFNTTTLRIETTSGDFEEEHMAAVKGYLGDRVFKKVVVKADVFSENVKDMVEMYNLESVELEINSLPYENIPFPKIKTISIRDNLNDVHGERLFSAKHFQNITCAIYDIDTLRKALIEWDYGEREVGRWTILKPFTVFQTPFGRRHRIETGRSNGYLYFISNLDSTQMPHGELTEYRFHPC